MARVQRYPVTSRTGLCWRRTQAHHSAPNSPADADTNNTAMLDVIRSARNPVTNVFTNTSAEGTSTAMTSGSRKKRSTCWMIKNSSHQNTTPCLNDHSNIYVLFTASCRLHASAQSPCDRSRMRHHSLPCTIPASDKWICATCHPDAHLTESGIKSHPMIMSKIPVHRFHAIQH